MIVFARSPGRKRRDGVWRCGPAILSTRTATARWSSPYAHARELPAAADLLTRREAVVLEACRREDFGIETLRRALGRADEIH